MKKFFNSLLDLLHSYVDIFVMGGIIVVIVLTINWRLNILFTKNTQDAYADQGNSQGEVEKPNIPPVELEDPDDEDPIDGEPDEPIQDIETPPVSTETISVEIPPGSTSNKIGDILSSKGLVSSSNEFTSKASEMSLDRKLQSGSFKIPKNSPLEDIVKIIAKQM